MNLNARSPGLYPAMFVTEPQDTLHSLIQKQYGVFPYDQPLHGLLLKYLHLLNPEVFSVTQPLGVHIPRSLNLIGPNPKDLICRNPDEVEKKIQQLMKPNGGFDRINNVSNFAPEDKESRALFEILLRASMAQDATTSLLGGGIGALGEIGSKSHMETLQKLRILRRQHVNGAMSRQQYNQAQKEVLRQFQKSWVLWKSWFTATREPTAHCTKTERGALSPQPSLRAESNG